jgi:MerR family transcriptional regulator, thiopeptide resistance regulator
VTAARGLTITRLGRRFGLSRSTLLYYDRIGLLTPSAQSASGYRLYGDADIERLARIVELRAAGLPLERIEAVLAAPGDVGHALLGQLSRIHAQVGELRAQQQVLLRLLDQDGTNANEVAFSKDSWSAMFRAIGLDEAAMQAWHAAFERAMPQAHADFLRSLGLSAEEVARIRARSRTVAP